MTATVRIIGIDPGLRTTGWGIIESDGVRLSYVDSGVIRPETGAELAFRLLDILKGLRSILQGFKPDEAAVEQTFVNKHPKATLKLGQARGIALLVPASFGLPVAEYAPNKVKKTVIGVGHGDKTQIRMMVKMLLPKSSFDTDDAADALAIAICHANSRGVSELKIAAAF